MAMQPRSVAFTKHFVVFNRGLFALIKLAALDERTIAQAPRS